MRPLVPGLLEPQTHADPFLERETPLTYSEIYTKYGLPDPDEREKWIEEGQRKNYLSRNELRSLYGLPPYPKEGEV